MTTPTTRTKGVDLKQFDHFIVGPNIFKVLTPPPDNDSTGSATLHKGKAIQRSFQLWGYNYYEVLPEDVVGERDVPPQCVAGMTTTANPIAGRGEDLPITPVEEKKLELPLSQSVNALDLIEQAQAQTQPEAQQAPAIPAAKPLPTIKPAGKKS